MSFKAKSFLVALVLCWIMLSMMLLLMSSEGHFLASAIPEGGMRILACFGVGLFASLIVCACIFLFSKNVKQQNEIMDELEKNGYSDRYIYLVREEVSRLSGQQLSQISLNYIIQLADAYLMRRQPEEAMKIINLVNPGRNPIFSPSKPMGITNQIKYYDVQISICEPLGQVDRANNIMREAMPLINRNMGKNPSNDMVIYEIMSVYNLLIGRFDEAMRYADSYFKYNSRMAKFLGNVMKVRVYAYLGDKYSAYQCYSVVESLVEKPVERDILNYLKEVYLQDSM